MSKIILVKHALPDVDESLPPAQWRLSSEGREAAAAFAQRIAAHDPTRLICSAEAKAEGTARAMGEVLNLKAEPFAALGEHKRSASSFLPRSEFDATIAALFNEPDVLVFGEETASEARHRFSAALDPIVAAQTGTLVVVAHGTVISLWVSHRLGVPAMPIWKALKMPGAAVVENGRYELVG